MYSNFTIIASIILALFIFNQIYLKNKKEEFESETGFFITDWLHTESSKTWLTIFLVISVLLIFIGLGLSCNSGGEPDIMSKSALFFNVGIIKIVFFGIKLVIKLILILMFCLRHYQLILLLLGVV